MALLSAVLLVTSGCGSGSSEKPPQPVLKSAAPLIASILPASATAGSRDLTLAITGSNFLGNAQLFTQAVWSASGTQTPLASTYDSSTQLTAVIPAALLKTSGPAQVLVQNIDQGGTPQATSTALNFNVTASGLPSAGFKATGDMAAARSGHSATLLPNGMVLVVGGADNLGVLASAEIYDPANGTFKSTGNLSTARQGHTATLVADGKVLIAGGEDNVGPIRSAELYNSATGQFISVGDMNNTRWSHTATLLANGKVLIAGGANDSNSQDTAEVFDPASGNFSSINHMNTARMHHTATSLTNGKVLLAGGWSSYSPITSLASAEVFDPDTNTFSSVGSMSIPRNRHKSTLLADGRVLILGGSEHQFSVASIEAFDPASDTFAGIGSMRAMRTSPAVTLLPNATLLISGGVDIFSGPDAPEFTVLASCELYAPASHASQFTGSLPTPRTGHSSTLLKNGAVLVVGGADGDGNALASAELYQ